VKQGGSTITQQVAKSLVGSEKSYIRKLKDMLLAKRIEERFTKDEILHLYLNQIYFGHGAYGVGEAARSYFGKKVGALTISEAALIAGLPKAPTDYSPMVNPAAAEQRRLYVLERMKEQGFIDAPTYERAVADRPVLHDPAEYADYAVAAGFTEEVRRALYKQLGSARVLRGGLVVETTMDLELQRAGVLALQRGLETYERRHGSWPGPERHVSASEIDAAIGDVARANGLVPPLPTRWSGAPQPLAPRRRDGVDARQARFTVATGIEGAVDVEQAAWAFRPAWKKDGGDSRGLDRLPGGRRGALRAPASSAADHEGGSGPARGAACAARYGGGGGRGGSGAVGSAGRVGRAGARGAAALGASPARKGAGRAALHGGERRRPRHGRRLRLRAQRVQPGHAGATAAGLRIQAVPVRSVPGGRLDAVVDRHGLSDQHLGRGLHDLLVAEHKNIYKGAVPMKEAIALAQQRGRARLPGRRRGPVIDYARRPVRSPLGRHLSLALGSTEISLVELVRAYGTFASGGKLLEPRFIRRVLDRKGKVLLENAALDELEDAALPATQPAVAPAPAVPAATAGLQGGAAPVASTLPARGLLADEAFLMTYLLRQPVENPHGTAHKAAALGRPLAGKTGTTNEQNDAWFIGFSPKVITGVWVASTRNGCSATRRPADAPRSRSGSIT
jgi:penicillin-binding protein 1A